MARPRTLEPGDELTIRAGFAAGLAIKQLVHRLGCDRTTLWRFCNSSAVEQRHGADVDGAHAPCGRAGPQPR